MGQETRTLNKLGYNQDAKSTYYRKYWRIHPDRDSKTLIQEYQINYQTKKKSREKIFSNKFFSFFLYQHANLKHKKKKENWSIKFLRAN